MKTIYITMVKYPNEAFPNCGMSQWKIKEYVAIDFNYNGEISILMNNGTVYGYHIKIDSKSKFFVSLSIN